MLDASHELAGELLALCLPARCAENSPSETGEPAGPPSNAWDALIQSAIQQGVAPLVAVRARVLPAPPAVRERLEALYRANALRNLRLAAEESRLSAAFTSAGIGHWTLKGPGLSERLYGDIGVRQVSDLDLLIEPSNLARADRLLAELGFLRQTSGKISSLARAQELLYVRGDEGLSSRPRESAGGTCSTPHARHFSGPPAHEPTVAGHPSPVTSHRSLYLDLHQRLLPYVRRDALAARVFREGMTAENLLLYLCANQITHRFARLRYLCDVCAFLDGEGTSLDWDRFLSSARALPWGPGIGLSLCWATEFSRRPVPAEVLRGLRPNPIGNLLLRRTLGANGAQAAARTRALDGSAGATIPLAAAYWSRPSAYGIAWNLLVPSRAYLREQTGAPPDQPLAGRYAARILCKIPGALRHLFRTTA